MKGIAMPVIPVKSDVASVLGSKRVLLPSALDGDRHSLLNLSLAYYLFIMSRKWYSR